MNRPALLQLARNGRQRSKGIFVSRSIRPKSLNLFGRSICVEKALRRVFVRIRLGRSRTADDRISKNTTRCST